MSLLHDGQDVVEVYIEETGTDGDGNPIRKPSAYAIKVRGRAFPVVATETGFNGQEIGTTYKFVCRSFPAGAYALVTWQGRPWDVLGEPQRKAGSEGIRHVTVYLKARRPEARYG